MAARARAHPARVRRAGACATGPLIISSGFHELIEPVLEREGLFDGSSFAPTASSRGRTAGACTVRVAGRCEVCGEPCKRADLPTASRSSTSGDGHSDRCASLAADRVFATREPRRCLGERDVPYRPLTTFMRSLPSWSVPLLRFPSRTTSSSRPSASAPSGPTSRTSGTRAGCTASSAGARCGSRRLAAASRSSRSTPRSRRGRAQAARRASSTSTPSTRRRDRPGRCGGSSTALAGFRPPLAPDPFETLVTSITAQQVSLYAAFAIRNRLIERYGRARSGARTRSRPAKRLAAARARTSSSRSGFSRRKAEYVIGLARSRARPRRARRAPRRRGEGSGSSRSAGSASGPPTGSSRATSPVRARGRVGDLGAAQGRRARSIRRLATMRESGVRFDAVPEPDGALPTDRI